MPVDGPYAAGRFVVAGFWTVVLGFVVPVDPEGCLDTVPLGRVAVLVEGLVVVVCLDEEKDEFGLAGVTDDLLEEPEG